MAKPERLTLIMLGSFIMLALAVCYGTGTAQAQTSTISGPPVYSELWGARLPRICNKVKSTPNPEQVKALIQCSGEGEISGYMELLQDITIELAPHDATARSFQIRGSEKFYQCTSVYDFKNNKGRNCGYYPEPNATGGCSLNAFSEWGCTMIGVPSDTDHASNVPGPTTS